MRKLAEQLVAQGREVHVLTRGGRSARPEEERHGVTVHRVAEPEWPTEDLQRFVNWVGHMNDDLPARGAQLGESLLSAACTPSTASPTCAWFPPSTSRSAWWCWRPRPLAARASSPTPAGCARSCPTPPSACASARDAVSLSAAVERVLTDEPLRAGLVSEAAEHVRRFDWADVARRTEALYEELAGAAV